MRKDLKLLTHVDSEIELNMIKGLFDDNEITILEEKKGSGAYLSVFSGFNYQGTNIYVAENDYTKSLELLKVIQDTKPIEESEPWEEGYKARQVNKKRKYAIIAIVIPFVLTLLIIVITTIAKLFT